MPKETYEEFKRRMQNNPANTDMYCKNCHKIYKNHYPGGVCVECLTPLIPYSNAPKCPTCHSYNIVSISQTKREFSAFLFGIANPTARAQFECKNCGYKW